MLQLIIMLFISDNIMMTLSSEIRGLHVMERKNSMQVINGGRGGRNHFPRGGQRIYQAPPATPPPEAILKGGGGVNIHNMHISHNPSHCTQTHMCVMIK